MTVDLVRIRRALVSVSDKSGVVDFCRSLAEFGVEIVSTGGTAKALAEAGVPVRAIDDLTGFPEMMDGRVKTLHPKVHGGLLARRDLPEHMAQAAEHGIEMIDLVCVNLYPFEETVARPGVTRDEAVEQIDIGGPAMLRSSAKNHAFVTVVTLPSDYDSILAEMAANDGATTLATRQRLAAQVFARTSEYDAAIAGYLGEAPTAAAASASEPPLHEHGSDRPAGFPEHLSLTFDKAQDLRYGENPHQLAAFFRDTDAASHTLARAEQLHGKELSYNNILDTDSAWSAVVEFEVPACVIVKHTNPCGTAIAADLPDAYARAYESDPISAYGGVVAFNRIVPVAVAEAMDERSQFVEVLIAPDFDDDALELLRRRKNIRLLRTGGMRHGTDRGWEMRTVEGGILVQTHDVVAEERASFTVPTKRQPTEAEWEQLLFAWKACKTVKSNAILLVRDFASIGVGAGQMSRVDSAKIAVEKAGDKAVGSVCASDAYMPFPDSLQVVGQAGATAVIQPGGSKRDNLAIEAADELDMAMVFTGRRHFRH